MKLKRIENFDQQFNHALSTLRKQIISGELKAGDYLLSENKLSERFGISRPSIRKVLAILEQEGLVATRRGKGSYVTDMLKFKTDKTETLKVGVFIPTYENCLQDSDLNSFERLHPLVKVQLQKITDDSNYYEIVQSYIHSEDPLDVIFIMDWHFQDFVHEEWAADLTPFIEKSELFGNLEADYYAQLFQKFRVGNRQLAIPFGFSPIVMAYNCDMFDRENIAYPDATWDWERFVETTKLLTHDWNSDGVFEQFGFGFSAHRHRWPSFVYRNNGNFIDPETGKCVISSQQSLEAIQFIADLLHQYKIAPPCISAKHIDSHLLFARSKIAMILVSYFSFMFVFPGLPFRWDIAPCPGKPDAPHLMLSTAFIVNKDSANQEIGWQFIEFLLSKKIQDRVRLRNSVVPIRKSSSHLHVEPAREIDPYNYNLFNELLDNFKYISVFPSTKISQPLWDEMGIVWANLQSPVQACNLIERKINLQNNSGYQNHE
ncbi:extracellular solute-binding protein [candidate division KSB1 bacterium]|nr:extracellular solute-binding protein [candidate division KSB1 bacterium]